jgi:pectate lyase
MIAKYVIGNRSSSASLPSLSEYVKQEINALQGNTYFELNESSPTTIGGNNAAHTLVYTGSISDSYTLTVDRERTMETIVIKDGTAYLIVYRENPELYPTCLHLVKKMVDSFEFK